MRNRTALVLVLALVVSAPCFAQGQLEPLPVKRHVVFLAEEVGSRLPPSAREEILAWAKRWESLDLKKRGWLEKVLFGLQELTKEQLDNVFQPVEKKAEDKRRAILEREFDRIAAQSSVPTPKEENYAVCVVVVAAGVNGKLGFGSRDFENLPRIAREIMPFGTFLSGISSSWFSLQNRPNWIGELLTGKRTPPLAPDGKVFKFLKPTLLHYFINKASAPQRKAWLITTGDKQNIIFDHLPLQPQWDERYRAVAITSVHLQRYDNAVRDHFLSELRDKKNALLVQNNLPKTLTAGKLRLDTDFDDPLARALIKDVIARRGGNTCDSNAFVQEMAVRLFQSSINPELVIVRFGPDWRMESERRPRSQKELQIRKMRDDDESAYNVWCAFRNNPYLRRKGYFIVLAEGHPGGIVVGPNVPAGQVIGSRFKLGQLWSTIVFMLGFDNVKKFGSPFNPKPSQPIPGLFKKK